MKIRQNNGAVLPFIAATCLVLVMIAVCFFWISLQIGGSRELMHATDAGSLSVAKYAIRKPDVSLAQAEESINFGGLMDKGNISLANYNRIVGQELLVSLNAQALGTATARANAEKLIEVVHGDAGIASKLTKALSTPEKMNSHFTAASFVNSVRMLGSSETTNSDDSQYAVAYLEEGSASNVDLDPATLPSANGNRVSIPKGATSSEKSKKNFSFISGYSAITVPGLKKSLSGVPVFPGKAPHLVSSKDFDESSSAPKGLGNVPPNSFKLGGSAGKTQGVSCAIVGALDTQFTACIPRGYIVIHNGPAEKFEGTLADGDQLFAKELNNGIMVGPGVGANRTFTTDSALYEEWRVYNEQKALGMQPAKIPSTNGIHGDPTKITAPATPVFWNTQAPILREMLPSFVKAYPHQNAGVQYSNNSLMALELYKAKVIEAFHKVTPPYHDPTDPYYSQYIEAPATPTGLKAFDHNAMYSGTIAFGQAGSLRQFLAQCNATEVLQEIDQRLRQIKPEASDQERNSVLNRQSIGMGQTLYIYKGLDNMLTISPAKPRWMNDGPSDVSPDGSPRVLKSTYDVNRRSVNANGDGGAPVYPWFQVPPHPQASDICTYTASSGYRNLLGELSFSNRVIPEGSSGIYADPN